MTDRRAAHTERGQSAIGLLLATAFALTAFVGFVDVLTVAYARSMMRFTVDDSARAGSRYGATVADCERRAAEAKRDLLAGTMGRNVTITCTQTAEATVARAEGAFPAWLPGIPTWQVQVSASATRERLR